jgi:hypothetical protein
MSDELDATPDESSVIKNLREKASKADDAEKRANELAARVAEMERRDAFRSAGLDPANRLHEVAMKGYDGDLDQAAVTQYVTELGLVEPAKQEIPEAEKNAFAQIGRQQAGGDVVPPPPSYDDDMKAFWSQLPPGSQKDQALVQWIEQNGGVVSYDGPQSDLFPMH